MNADFTRALARAMEHVRAQDPAQATAILQAALGQTLPDQAPEPTAQADPIPLPRRSRIAPDAADAETVEAAPHARPADRSADGSAHGPRVPRGERRSLGEVVELLRTGRAAFEGPKPTLPNLDLSS